MGGHTQVIAYQFSTNIGAFLSAQKKFRDLTTSRLKFRNLKISKLKPSLFSLIWGSSIGCSLDFLYLLPAFKPIESFFSKILFSLSTNFFNKNTLSYWMTPLLVPGSFEMKFNMSKRTNVVELKSLFYKRGTQNDSL